MQNLAREANPDKFQMLVPKRLRKTVLEHCHDSQL